MAYHITVHTADSTAVDSCDCRIVVDWMARLILSQARLKDSELKIIRFDWMEIGSKSITKATPNTIKIHSIQFVCIHAAISMRSFPICRKKFRPERERQK